MVVRYEVPTGWIRYEPQSVFTELTSAKAAMLALTEIPYQRSWADALQQVQLKREVAGTSRIEGAELTEKELDAAMRETPAQLETRSQRQAAAAVATYTWIPTVSGDRPLDAALIADVHRLLVTGCDDDHCPPGRLRGRDENVTFGAPKHRGVEGGDECTKALGLLVEAARTLFREHDPLIQALAVHYHVAAMHPFLDGNGRTARALEALMLRRTGLRDTLFIAMSNYYYEHKAEYLSALNDVRAAHHDLTPFLKFALRGIERQSRRLFVEIRTQVAKALFRNTMTDLFGRLRSRRKRVMSSRHLAMLNLLLEGDLRLTEMIARTGGLYTVKNPWKAMLRDLNYLAALDAIKVTALPGERAHLLSVNLDWPTTITETEFFRLSKNLPKGKTFRFLSS
jgi:Fic family protein